VAKFPSAEFETKIQWDVAYSYFEDTPISLKYSAMRMGEGETLICAKKSAQKGPSVKKSIYPRSSCTRYLVNFR